MEKFLIDNLLSVSAFLVSFLALALSFFSTYLEHLKRFTLELEEGASVTVRGGHDKVGEKKWLTCIPILFVNQGARGGLVKSFQIYIRSNGTEMQENASIIMEDASLVNIGRRLNVFNSFYLRGHESVYKLLAITVKTLAPGNYNVELVAMLLKNKYVKKAFKFKLDEEKIEFLNSGGSVGIPVEGLKGIYEMGK